VTTWKPGGTAMVQADPVGAALYAKKPDLHLDNTAWKYATTLFPELDDQIIVPEVDPRKLANLDIITELQEEPVYHVRNDGRPFLRGKIWHIIDALTNARATRGAIVRVLREAGY
jgi:hypothetical protein